MSKVGAGIDKARTKLGAKAGKILTDLCDLVTDEKVTDGFSGHKQSETIIATDVPCEVSNVAAGGGQLVSGKGSYQASPQIKFGFSEETLAITPDYRIKVHARADVPEMVFEKPVRSVGSKSPWLIVSATLTTGFREPASV